MARKRYPIYSRALQYVRPYRGRIALSMIASIGVAGTDAALAKLVQPFVDRIVVAGETSLFKLVPLLVIGLAVFKGLSRYVQEYFIRTSGQLIVRDIRDSLDRHAVSLSMGFFSRTPAGSLISRILNDVGVMQIALSDTLVSVVRESITLVGLTGVAFYTDWKMAAIAFLVLPLAGWPASVIGKKIKNYSRQGQTAMGSLTTVLEQTFSGIKVIKAFGTEEVESEKFQRENQDYYRFIRKVLKYDSGSAPVIEIISALGVAVVIWYGMHRVISGEMTHGELFSVMAAILLMYTPTKRLTRVNNIIQQAAGAAERVFELLEETPEVVDSPGAVDLSEVKGEVVFDRVHFAYDQEEVLSDFSLRVSPGEVVALVGPSGAGKTTVAGLLTRFYEPTSGDILIDGHKINEVTQASLKRNIALVDQETFLFNDTIGNNILYGRADADLEAVKDAARLAFADQFIEELPEGYETRIGDRGLRVSGGQRQRIAIARAILRNAPILILDEATSALDTESEAMVQKALGNLMENRTTFVIAHRLSTIMHADRIVVLNRGRIEAVGSHQDLLETDGLYRKLYQMQFRDGA